MSWTDGLLARIRETVLRRSFDAELDEEISYHLEREARRLIEEGHDPETAEALARRRFGGVRRVREAARAEKGFAWLEGVARDLKHAARGLRKSPAFAATAVLTFGLGIGATTAIFTVLDGVVLRPLPYTDGSRIVRISHSDGDGDRLGIPSAGYLFYGENASTLGSLAAYLEVSEPLVGTGGPLELGTIYATPELFDVLGVAPLHGRAFDARDAEPGAPDVAVLMHAFWVRRYGADPDVIGQEVLPGSGVEIIGVMPPEFEFVRPDPTIAFGNAIEVPQILAPLTIREEGARFGNFIYQGIARLGPGASAEAAQRELTSLMPRAAETYPGGHTVASLREGGHHPLVVPVKDALVGRAASTLWLLLGAVGFVLLISIANVANLFVARADARSREIAVRRSLGAGSGALARAAFSEGLLLAVVGGGLGVLLALAGTQALLGLAPSDIPRLDEVAFRPAVLVFAAALTIAAGLGFGAFPLLRFGRVEARSALGRDSRGGTAGRDRQQLRRGLVAAQVALALVLLVGAALLGRTFQNLRAVDPGFESEGVLTLKLSLPDRYEGDVGRSRFLVGLTERLEGLPGVERATFAGDLPLDAGLWRDAVDLEGALSESQADQVSALRVFIGPGYLATIGARILRGRELERREFDDYPRTAVVNEAFVRQRWPDGENPIGRRIMQAGNDPEADVWYTVVGVVADIREASLMDPPEPTVYLPTAFNPDDDYAMFVSNMPVLVRTAGDPTTLFASVEREIHAIDPEIPINQVMTLARLEARSFQQVSFATVLVLVAAGVALILGIIGIWGVVAYLVSLRTREFGIRIALGATPRHLRTGIVREALGIGGAGLAAGLAVAILLTGVLRSMLYGVRATDPVTYVLVCAVLLVAVVLAALGPARRATSVDPVDAIRAD